MKVFVGKPNPLQIFVVERDGPECRCSTSWVVREEESHIYEFCCFGEVDNVWRQVSYKQKSVARANTGANSTYK